MNKYQLRDEPDILKRVTVRLIEDFEQVRFDFLIEQKHYLGSSKVVGRSLRYVAELDGEWVALATFSAASLHLKARERWIGWSPRQRARRLDFVVNNSRYLILPERERLPNLGSRVLGMILRRLRRDWEERWGNPIFAVESFVDETRYRGTCYRACGFEAVGATAGFKRDSRDFYTEHSEPKQLYLRELEPGARNLLQRGRWPEELARHERQVAGPCPWRASDLESLLDRFRELKDTRRGHGLRHRQPFVLACAATAVMMGAGSYKAIEDTCMKFTQRQLKALGCPRNAEGVYRPPSDSTFYRVLSKIDTHHLDRIIGDWLLKQEISTLERLAVDGKTLRGSSRADGKPLQLLSAVTHHLRLTLAQVPIDKKSNEIPAFPKLIRDLPPIEHTVVTADAMNCQQESARVVTQERGWDYCFGLKGNQSGILETAQRLLEKQAFPPSGGRALGEGALADRATVPEARGGDAGADRTGRMLAGYRGTTRGDINAEGRQKEK
jgi:hypothetical protein